MSFHSTSTSGTSEGKNPLRFKYAFFIRHRYNILYCKADGSYTDIYFNEYPKEKASYRICIIEKELNPDFFLRCHYSYIVNIYCVKSICCRKCCLILKNNEEIPVSRDKKDEVIAILRKVFVPEE
jgi:two-component system LytT family response regulator